MKISKEQIQEIKKYPNSIYNEIKREFLFHSNKIEGSTFTKENLDKYLDKKVIEGSHNIDDVFETINSVELFDFVILNLGEKITKTLILEFHRMLKQNTLDFHNGFSGVWKKIPNIITGSDIKLAQPWEVDLRIEDLLKWWEISEKNYKNITRFHGEFEKIHPFQDGNGRIGRFIMLKQCVENNIGLIAIDEKYNDDYKKALKEGQKIGDYTLLEEIFEKCQEFLHDKNEILTDTLKCLKSEEI
ncbi:Fic family protein [Clostridium vincentii]|uniref:Fic/DOC family protein n=1 Tax=Clostridium vincentii TaxID=52704 RepID=A0A2T0B7L5_9CLOT|nr:Fic family protein [Clostridium vincentii]PRR79862.1 Fic/DOC family protein [Clostridium vincentii]